VKPMPSASELRIQMLLDGAMQQASLRNMHVYQCSHITHFMALSFNLMLNAHPGQVHKCSSV